MQNNPPTTIPEQFSSVYGLGTAAGYFPVGKTNRWVSAILAVVFIGAAGIAAIFGVYNTYLQTTKFGSAVLWRTIWPPMLFGAIFFLLGLALAYSAYTNWNKAVVVYEKGLAYADRNGLQAWRWDEVEQFFISIVKHYTNGIPTGTTYLYTLKKADGAQLKLDNKFTKIQNLGNLIQRNIAPFQYESLVKALKNGQTVTLGALAISNNGISIGKKAYPWAEIEQVGIQQGQINLKKKGGGWFSGASVPVSSTPNLDALLMVVDQIVKVKAG
jgi:hypothetical protein